VRENASDVHLDPTHGGYQLRFRIDGAMVDTVLLETEQRNAESRSAWLLKERTTYGLARVSSSTVFHHRAVDAEAELIAAMGRIEMNVRSVLTHGVLQQRADERAGTRGFVAVR